MGIFNLAIAILSTLAVLRKYREAIKLLVDFRPMIESFDQQTSIFDLLHANLLYQAHKT